MLTGPRAALVECRTMHRGNGPFRWGTATRLLAVAIFALPGALVSDAGAAPGKGEYIGSWSVSGSLGVAVPNTDEFANAFAWGVAAGYSPTPRFEFSLETGRFEAEVFQPEANGVSGFSIASGTLAILPVCLSARHRTPLANLLSTLTLLVGVGYYFVDYSMAEAPKEYFRSGGVQGLPDQIVENAWGFHFGAGLEYALTGHISLGGEARYVFLSPQTSGTASPGRRIDGSLDLNTWLFTGGLKVAF